MKAAGIGFQSGTPSRALRETLATIGTVERIATAAPKAGALAEALGKEVEGVEVAGVVTPTQSRASLAAHGTGSVAEAAALVAAGHGARILLTRQIIGGVTIAVAEGDEG